MSENELGGRTLKGPKIQNFGRKFWHLTANISKTVSHSITCQLELNNSSMGAF